MDKKIKKYSETIYKKGTETAKKAIKTRLIIIGIILLIITVGIIVIIGVIPFYIGYRTPVLEQPASPDYDGNIELHWDDTGAGKYQIYRNDNGENSGFLSIITEITTNSYTDTGLPIGIYTYAVIAKYGLVIPGLPTLWSYSDYSNSVTVIVETYVAPPSPPSKPVLNDIIPSMSLTGIIDLSWNDVSTATEYWVYRSVDSGNNIRIATISGITYKDTLTLDGVYTYRIIAWSYAGSSGFSDPKSVKVVVELVNTPLLGAIVPDTSTDGYITLEWSYVDGATNYIIYADIDGGGYNEIKTGATSPCTLYRAQNGEHSFYIEAMGLGYIAESNVKSVTIEIPNPLDETELAITSPSTSTDGDIELSWSDISDAISYRLYRSDNAGDYEKIWTTPLTYYTDTIIVDGYYSYYIICENDDVDSPDSNVESVTVELSGDGNGNGDGEPPDKTTLSAIYPTKDTDGDIELSWLSISDATSYEIWRSKDAGTYLSIITVYTNSYIDPDLSDGEYNYKVMCINDYGESELSNVKSVTVELSDNGDGDGDVDGEPEIPTEIITIVVVVIVFIGVVILILRYSKKMKQRKGIKKVQKFKN